MDIITLCTAGAFISGAALVKLLVLDSTNIKEYDVRNLVIKLDKESELPPHKRYKTTSK